MIGSHKRRNQKQVLWVNVRGTPCANFHYNYYALFLPSLEKFSAELCKHRGGTDNEKGDPRAQVWKVLPIPSTLLEGVSVPGTRGSASPVISAPHNPKGADALTLFFLALLHPRQVSLSALLCLWVVVHQRWFGNWKWTFMHSFVQWAPSIPGTVLNPWERPETKAMFSWSL